MAKAQADPKDVNLPYKGSEPERQAQLKSAAARPLYSDKEVSPALVKNRDFYRRKATTTRKVSR